MTRTKQTKRKNCQDGNARKKKRVKESITSDPISINLRGFYISYNPCQVKTPYSELVSQATQLLNVYADKVYRIDEKTCSIKHRQTDPSCPLIFIESNMEDPALLVDAVYTDLLASPHKQCDDVKNVQYWSRLLPVQMICIKKYEDLVSNAKALLKPILEEDEKSKIKIILHGFKDYSLRKQVFDELLEYLGSKGSIVEHDPDIGVVLRSCGKICLISLIRDYVKYKKYSIKCITKETLDQEMTDESCEKAETGESPVLQKEDQEMTEEVCENAETGESPVVQKEDQEKTDESCEKAEGGQSPVLQKEDQEMTEEVCEKAEGGESPVLQEEDQETTDKSCEKAEGGESLQKDDQVTVADNQTTVSDQIVKSEQTATNNRLKTANETVAGDQTTILDHTVTDNKAMITTDRTTEADQTVADSETVTKDQKMTTDQTTAHDQTVTDNQTVTDDQTVTNDQKMMTDRTTAPDQTVTDNQTVTDDQTTTTDQTPTSAETVTKNETMPSVLPNGVSTLQCQDIIVTSEVNRSVVEDGVTVTKVEHVTDDPSLKTDASLNAAQTPETNGSEN